MSDNEREYNEPSRGLSDTEIAIIDAFKTLADQLMAINPNAVSALATSFEHQRNAKLQAGQPGAAVVFGLLHRFVADPERQLYREQIRQLLTVPPRGRG